MAMLIRLILLWVIYVSLLIPEPIHAQGSPILHYTSNEGLPSNTVYSIYRDSKGFLWIATDNGIAKYNGSKFEVYTTLNGLPDNEVFFFEEDQLHRLWLGCNNGALCYLQNDTFFTAENKGFLRMPVKLPHLQHIEVESDSSVTISFSTATTVINIYKNRIRHFNMPKVNAQVGEPQCFFQKKISRNLYKFTYANATAVVDTNNNIVELKRNTNQVYRFTSCQAQTYLFSHEYFFNIDGQNPKPFPEIIKEGNYPIEIYNDGKHVFFATYNGLIIDDSIRLFEGKKVSSITQDLYGNYWISTLNDGIYCMGNANFNIRLYKDVYQSQVSYTHITDKDLFFATYNSELFRISDNKITTTISRDCLARYGISRPYQSAFYIDSNYHYYNFYEHITIRADNVRAASPPIHVSKSTYNGFRTVFSANNLLYIRQFRSVAILSKDSCRHLGYVSRPTDDRIAEIAQDENNDVWYSTISSVFKIEGNNSVLQKQFKNITFKYFEFNLHYLIGITHNNKLVIINQANGNFVVDTVPAPNYIWERIYKLDTGHVIAKTNNFYTILTLYPSPGKPKYSLHIVENPFIPSQAESIVACGKTVYFFNSGSITSIDMDKLFYAPGPPRLFFTKIQTNKETYPINPLVTIAFNESKTLKISFSSLSFSNVKLFRQYAIFKNGQYSWTDFNADEVNLANPGYGDYTVMIRAKTFSSAYSTPITFTLRILRPFWASWWFAALVSCLVIVLLIALVLFTKRTALRATQRKNLQMELELKAIYAQINPHFIFNTLNSALLLVRKKRFEDAYTHISQFSRLLRNYIKSSRNKLITIADEIINLEDYLQLQQTRFVNKFEFTIFVDHTIIPSLVKIPALLLQPFVENALNHGLLPQKASGHLTIEFVKGTSKDEIICKIDDNGIGRSNARERETAYKDDSYGNLLIRDLVNIFNKYEQMNIAIQYIDKKEPLTGTTILISIKHPHYV